MNSKRVFNTIFFAVAIYAFYLKAPEIFTHFKFQDQKAPDFTVSTLKGESISIQAQPKKIILVFWATWCGPCEAELKRINEMVMERKIQPSDVLAINLQEDEKLVREVVLKKNYLFNVAIDKSGSISNLYQVKVTPTVVFIDNNHVINWMTAGMSPTLSFRISSFLK